MKANSTNTTPHSRPIEIPDDEIDPEVAAFYGPRLNLVVVELMMAEKKREAGPIQPTARMATRAEQFAAGVQRRRMKTQQQAAAAAAGD